MNLNEYQYNAAGEVADALNSDPDVTQNSLHNALINAMTRIARLEKQIAELKSWQDADDERDVGRHRGFWMGTPDGREAHILGDPKMSARTRKALAAMIDAAAKAAQAGTLAVTPNESQMSHGAKNK